MRRNRRFVEILAEREARKDARQERQSMMAFWIALPLAIVQLLII